MLNPDKLPPGERSPTPADCYRFVLSHPAVSTVIPGMRCVRHVVENAAVSDGKLLSNEELRALREHAFAHGWQYPWSQTLESDS